MGINITALKGGIKAFTKECKFIDSKRAVSLFDDALNSVCKKRERLVGKGYATVRETIPIKINEFDPPKNFTKIISDTRQIKDKSGKLIRTEYLTPSVIDGLHNWKAVYPDGTIKPLIDIKKGKNGILSINKEMDSFDGTITKSRYKKLPDGSWAMRVDIAKDGRNLAQKRIKHKFISQNEAESIVNGEKYRVLYSQDKIKVLNSKGEEDCIIDLKTLIDDNNTPENALKFKTMLKECSADELKVISRKLKKLTYTEYQLSGGANTFQGTIRTGDNIFVFRHELGHLEDFSAESGRAIYSASGDFKKVYNEELNEVVKNFDIHQKEYLNYFINNSEPAWANRSLMESAAELSAINKSSKFSGDTGIRTEYLERYFPKARSFLLNA